MLHECAERGEPDALAFLQRHAEELSPIAEAALQRWVREREGRRVKEARCGGTLTFADLVSRDPKHPFEIEHIWANHPEQHPEFLSEQAFADQRNRFGGLLLLPKDFNGSYGDKSYSDKLKHYFGQNILARSLHPTCYEHNPTFRRLIE